MDLTKRNKFIKKPTTQSKLDKQLEASVFFKETSEWLKDAAKELTSIHDDLKPELQNRKSKSRMQDSATVTRQELPSLFYQGEDGNLFEEED